MATIIIDVVTNCPCHYLYYLYHCCLLDSYLSFSLSNIIISYFMSYHYFQIAIIIIVIIGFNVIDMFLIVATCRHLSPNVVKRHRMSPNIVKCCRMSPLVVKCFRTLTNLTECRRMSPNVAECNQILSNVAGCRHLSHVQPRMSCPCLVRGWKCLTELKTSFFLLISLLI